MVSAVVLLTTERGKINQVAEALAEMAGVSEVYSVGGRFDLVAIIRVADNDTLAELVTNHMLLIEGIVHSETLIAFPGLLSPRPGEHVLDWDVERLGAAGLTAGSSPG